MTEQITIGADPELFVTNRLDSKIIPVCGRLGGTKTAPKRMRPDWPEGYSLQEDNVMLEFNIPPCSNSSSFQSAIKHSLDHIGALLATRSMGVNSLTEHTFLNKDLAQHKQAMEFGCSPDFDAYSHGAPNRKVDKSELAAGTDKEWRFCGGHVHIGYNAKIPPFAVAGLMDIALGLPSIGEDTQVERRKFYGTAGRYRPTKYGIEYRTLSNYWIWNTTQAHRIATRVFGLGRHLQGSPGILQSYYIKMPWQDIKTAIDTNNHDLARQISGYISEEVGFKMELNG